MDSPFNLKVCTITYPYLFEQGFQLSPLNLHVELEFQSHVQILNIQIYLRSRE